MTNFNFTKPEIDEVHRLKDLGWLPFVNCNAKTRIKKVGVPVVVTVTPDCNKFIKPKGYLKDIAAIRIKFVLGGWGGDLQDCYNDAVCWAWANCVEVLWTPMRFKHGGLGYAHGWGAHYYKWDRGWYRLTKPGLKRFEEIVADKPFHVCDKKNEGCPSCRLCSRLTYARKDLDIYGIDLSASGHCPFSCPDCWAKPLTKMAGGKIAFDKPKRNRKQLGHK